MEEKCNNLKNANSLKGSLNVFFSYWNWKSSQYRRITLTVCNGLGQTPGKIFHSYFSNQINSTALQLDRGLGQLRSEVLGARAKGLLAENITKLHPLWVSHSGDVKFGEQSAGAAQGWINLPTTRPHAEPWVCAIICHIHYEVTRMSCLCVPWSQTFSNICMWLCIWFAAGKH